ncbi:hypothetical protein JW960_15060 [candidate division KSB1 bacterium]|nr:hypothetical protein [candidate division KSB1 bacterium]
MNMSKQLNFILMLLLLSGAIIAVSPVQAGSYYNIDRVGNFIGYQYADAFGRGGTSIGIQDNVSINSNNPANLYAINITRISATFSSESISAKSATATGNYNYSSLRNVRLSIPIWVDKCVISLGLMPLTRNEYSAETESKLDDGSRYFMEIENSGGLNQAQAGFSAVVNKWFSFGLVMNYNFGKIQETNKIDYVSSVFKDANDRIITNIYGASFKTGMLLHITPDLTFGATYTAPSDLNAHSKIQYTFSTVKTLLKEKLQLPQSWGLGASYTVHKNVRFSGDYQNRPWNSMKIFGKPIANINSGYNFNLGVELLGNTNKLEKGLKKITYRAGFAYEQLNIKTETNNNVNEILGMIGFGIPFYGGWGNIDCGFGYGKRGDLSTNPVEETFVKFLVNISGGEKWFVRSKK